MASRNDTQFRAGLSEALDQLAPSPAPVATVMRRAESIRKARRIGLGGGVTAVAAAVVAAVVIVPGASAHGGNHGTNGPTFGTGSSRQVVINRGTIGGRPWHVVLSKHDGEVCAWLTGLRRSCVNAAAGEHLNAGLASLAGMSVQMPHEGAYMEGPPENVLIGTVRPGVTQLDVRMSNGAIYTLSPVRIAGRRWIGLVTPLQPGLQEVIAYRGTRELGYSVPFYGGEIMGFGRPFFVTWLRPGEHGPAQADRYIASAGHGGHSWSASIIAGQFGYCMTLFVPLTNGAEEHCLSVGAVKAGAKVIERWGSPPTEPRWFIGTARPDVAYLKLVLAGGGTTRVRVSEVSGQKFYAMQVSQGEDIARWGAFDAAGHRLYGGTGAPDAAG